MKYFGKRFRKIISICIVFVILSLSFVFSASAEVYYQVDIPISKPEVTSNTGYIEILYENVNGGYTAEVIMFTDNATQGGGAFRALIYDNEVRVYNDSNGAFTGFFVTELYNSGILSDSVGYISDSFYGVDIVGFRCYGCYEIENYLTYDNSARNYQNWSINYGQDASAVSYLKQILSVLGGQSNSDVIDNANSNADKITQSQDENADKIIQNQKDQTDSITNGWNKDGDKDTTVDNSTVDEHNELDNTISNNNQIGMNEAKDLFTNFSFNDGGSVYRGLLAVTNVFNKFSNIPLFSNILKYSLVVGLFAFVIGITVFVAKKGGNK